MMREVDKINTRNKRLKFFIYYWGITRNSLRKNGLVTTAGKSFRALNELATSRFSHRRS